MLSEWFAVPGVTELLDHYGEATGIDLRLYGTESDAETIKDTAIAQPLIVAASLISFHALTREMTENGETIAVRATAGHSVGEFAAAAVSGALRDDDALTLVGKRGEAMATAAAIMPTGMSAVLGGDADEVLAKLSELDLVPANVNGGGQIIAAGAVDALAQLAATPPTGVRIMPLAVAGAFHTPHMRSAQELFTAAAQNITPGEIRVPMLSNADGRFVSDGASMLDRLTAQITRPVRWDLCQQTLTELPVTGVLELAPAGVLTGLARRAMRGVETFALKGPGDLAAAAEFAHRHSTQQGDNS